MRRGNIPQEAFMSVRIKGSGRPARTHVQALRKNRVPPIDGPGGTRRVYWSTPRSSQRLRHHGTKSGLFAHCRPAQLSGLSHFRRTVASGWTTTVVAEHKMEVSPLPP